MNIKAFFVAALQSALDQHVATTDDILRHVTPELLSQHLPRPLWARLLTACVGAPRVDATLVVETVGIPNLCEHIPSPVIWNCLAEIGTRALGGVVPEQPMRWIPASTPAPIPIAAPPPPEPTAVNKPPPPPPPAGPAIPAPSSTDGLDNIFGDLEREEKTVSAPPAAQIARARTPTGQRFRQSPTNSGIGRLANTAAADTKPAAGTPAAGNPRRPQAVATEPNPTRSARRAATEVSEYEVETNVNAEEWKSALAVDDEQLVDWQSTEETEGGDHRKR